MSRWKRSRRLARAGGYASDSDHDAGFDVSSLVDVGFLLLIYFLVTSTLLPREADLGLNLFRAPGGVPVKISPVTIQVSKDGDVSVAGIVLDSAESGRELPGLLKELKPYVTASSEMEDKAAVVIFAANEACQQRLVDVLNAVSKVGVTNVTFDSGWYTGDEKGE